MQKYDDETPAGQDVISGEYIVEGKVLKVNGEWADLNGKEYKDLSTMAKLAIIVNDNPALLKRINDSLEFYLSRFRVIASPEVVMYYPIQPNRSNLPRFSLDQVDSTLGIKYQAAIDSDLPIGEILGKIKRKKLETVVERPEFAHLNDRFGGNRTYLIRLLQPLIVDQREIHPTGSFICITFSQELAKEQPPIKTIT